MQIESAEIDEMWSFVRKEEINASWHAIDHETGDVLAYVLGERKEEVFAALKNSWAHRESI